MTCQHQRIFKENTNRNMIMPPNPPFYLLLLLTFPCIYIYKTMLFVKQNLKLFLKEDHSNENMYTLKRSNTGLIKKSHHRTTFYEKQLNYNGIELFNKLPCTLRMEVDEIKFKRELKSFLIEKSYYSVKEYYEDMNSNQSVVK